MGHRRASLSITLTVAVVATTLTAVPTTPAHAVPYETSTTGVRVVRVPGIALGEALDINDHGAVVGSGRRLDGAGQAERAAFYWAGPGRGEAVQISPNYETGGVITYGAATALNDSSEVVGQHALPPSGVDGNRTFYWTPQAGRQTLAMPGTQPSFIRRQSATGIDATGSIVGYFSAAADVCSTGATTCAFRGPPDDLETLPAADDGLANLAFDVSAGRIVGSGWTWTSTAGFTTLPGDFAWGAAINTAGAVAGQVRDPGTSGAMWDDDPDAAYWPSPTSAPIELPNLSGVTGDVATDATDLNDLDRVVGWAENASGEERAFIWAPGEAALTDLGTLGGANSRAMAINNDGLIAGWAEDANGSPLPVIWDPSGTYEPDLPPAIDPLPFFDLTAVPEETLTIEPAISDPNGDAWTVSWGPANLEFEDIGPFTVAEVFPDASQVGDALEWTPSPDDPAGFYVARVTATQVGAPQNTATLVVAITLVTSDPPVLEPIGDQTAQVGVPFTLSVSATDPDGDDRFLRYDLEFIDQPDALPGNGFMDRVDGVFTWTPTAADLGPHVVVVTVTDLDGARASERFTITVEPAPSPDTAPSIAPIDDITIDELAEVVVAPEVTDAEGDPYTLTWTGVPSGADTNGPFTWTPTEAQGPGSYEITVTATQDDDPSLSDSETFTITVNEVNLPPVLDPIDNQTVAANSTLNLAATARDADLPEQPLSFAIWGEEVELPAVQGIAIDPVSGEVTWTPTDDQVGDHAATVEVTDGAGGSDAVSFTIRVSPDPSNLPPVIEAIDDVTVDEGSLVTIVPVVYDPDEDPFELDWGEVPEGAVINGIYEWTPTEAQGPGIYPITLTATDDRGGTTTRSFAITVDEVNEPPAIDPVDDQSVEAGAPLAFTVEASDPDIPVQDLTFSLQDAPAGAGIDATTGEFSWTPTSDQVGQHTFDLIVSDGADTVTQQVTVTVTAPQIVTDLFVDRFERVAADPDGDGDILSGTEATFEVDYGASPDHDDAPEARLTVTIDAEELGIGNGVGFVVTDPGPCAIATSPDQSLTCELGPLEAGDRGTLAFTIQPLLVRLGTSAPYDADIELTARIDTSVTDLWSGTSGLQNNQRTISDVVRVRQADLRTILRRPVPLFGALDPVFIGETTSFEVLVDNLGPDRGPDAQVAVEWTDAAWALHAAPDGCTELASGFTCDLGDIDDGEQAPTVTFALTETDASVTNHRITAVASSGAVDRAPANNTMALNPDPVERTSDINVSLELLSGAEDGTTRPREQLTYRATVRNDGPHDSLQTDLVVGFVGHYGGEVTVIDDGGCDTIDGSFPIIVQGLSCDLGPLPAGSFAVATVDFTVEVPLDEQDPWVVSASASTTSVDPDATNDRTTLGLRVDATEADLLLQPGFLGDPPTVTVVDREATWSFVYANGGPDTALAPALTIEVTGETEATVAGPDCSEDEPTPTTTLFTCELEDLPFTIGGGTDTAVVTLSSATTGPISVEASISHPGTDPDTTNDTLGWSLTVVPDPGDPQTGPLLVEQTTIDPGQDLGIEGSGFAPGSPVPATLFSDPTELGQYVADDAGTVATSVTIPVDTAPGAHRIVLTGVDPEGNGVILAATVCVSTCADEDADADGLTDHEEETLTGTDPSDPDSDGDGLVDGLDPSWLDAHVAAVPASSFRWGWFGKLLLRVRLALLEVAVHQASWDDALALIDEAASRADGCGMRPDLDDLIRDCEAQAAFRTRLELLRRNVAQQIVAA
jgi:probable HAF family extracellular repeat protein